MVIYLYLLVEQTLRKKIIENYKSVLEVLDKETQGLKTVVKSTHISTTMGPSAKIALAKV